VVDVHRRPQERFPDRAVLPLGEQLFRLATERAVGVAVRAHAGVDVLDQAGQRQHRVRHDVAVVAGVQGGRPAVVGDQLDTHEAAYPHHQGRRVLLLRPVGADEQVGGQAVAMGAGDGVEVRASVLLLAVEDDANPPLGAAGGGRVEHAQDVG
jgi:hypothetical protein